MPFEYETRFLFLWFMLLFEGKKLRNRHYRIASLLLHISWVWDKVVTWMFHLLNFDSRRHTCATYCFLYACCLY